MYRNTFFICYVSCVLFYGSLCAQSDAQIYERTCDAKTYPFSDPSPVATPNNSYYPYFRFDGFFYASAGEAVENGCFGK